MNPPVPDSDSGADLAEALYPGDRDSFLRTEPGDDLVSLLVDSWQKGQPIPADEILRRHPGCDDSVAIRLVFEEVALQRDAGIGIDTQEFLARYPTWRRELEILLACDRALRPSPEVGFPTVGDRLGGFQLLAELGRGGAGRTFLASQPDLADRLVALKLIADDREEHLTLARLQHTHIVPLYTENVFPESGLRGLCMPYFGGVDLSALFDRLVEIPLDRRSGATVLAALDAGPAPAIHHPNSPGRRFLQGATYEQAVCWIAACLAEALRHAHELGLVHMDIKPSNVLLTDDARPMLLDFHMARPPLLPQDPSPGRLGGTVGWMSPEQVKAGQAIRRGQPIVDPVDDRTDIHALGLLMIAAFSESQRSGAKPSISQGMRAIINRCIEPAPMDRYPTAAVLLDDLKNHLLDRPLRGVQVRSWSERWAKWRRRQPQALSRWVIAVLALVILGLVASAYLVQHEWVDDSIEVAQRLREGGNPEQSLEQLARARRIAAWLPGSESLRARVETETRLSFRDRLAGELHPLATQLRFRMARPDNPTTPVELASAVEALWNRRRQLLPEAGQRRDPPGDQQLRDDLHDLAIGWARIQNDSGSPDEALATLDEAIADLGDDGTLRLSRELARNPRGELPDLPPPGKTSAREFDNLGRLYLARKRHEVAIEAFRRSIEEAPDAFWPHYYRGVCAFVLGRYPEALESFQTCLALDPTNVHCLDHCARTLEQLGRVDEAARASRRAEAYRNRPPGNLEDPRGSRPRP